MIIPGKGNVNSQDLVISVVGYDWMGCPGTINPAQLRWQFAALVTQYLLTSATVNIIIIVITIIVIMKRNPPQLRWYLAQYLLTSTTVTEKMQHWLEILSVLKHFITYPSIVHMTTLHMHTFLCPNHIQFIIKYFHFSEEPYVQYSQLDHVLTLQGLCASHHGC